MKKCKKNLHFYEGRRCLECAKIRQKEWQQKEKEKVALIQQTYRMSGKKREKFLQKTYGLSLEDFNKMFIKQKGQCKICNKHQSELSRALVVDHCHSTGRVRGLLCHQCNHALGLFYDNKESLLNAIKHLEGEE